MNASEKKRKKDPLTIAIVAVLVFLAVILGTNDMAENTNTNMSADDTNSSDPFSAWKQKRDEEKKQKEEKQKQKEEQRKQEEEKAAVINSIDSKTVEEAQQIIAPYQMSVKYSKYGDQSGFETEDVANSFGSPINDLIVVKHDYDYENSVKMYILSRGENDIRLKAEALEKTYSKDEAIIDLKTYGESHFYKFHLGIIQAADANQTTTFVNETTWHVKSKCTVTNLYGIEVAHNIEADVHTDHTVENVQVY